LFLNFKNFDTRNIKIDAFCSWPHYGDHIAPIWNQIPLANRGNFVVPSRPLAGHMQKHGIEAVIARHDKAAARSLQADNPIIVAGYTDLIKQKKRPIVFVEHGAGQTYFREDGSVHGGYSGGRNRGKVGLFLCPNKMVAQRNLLAYPQARSVPIGSPRLDDLFALREKDDDDKLAVAISFHWDCQVVPESGSAFKFFADQIKEFVRWANVCDVKILGHGHPKAWVHLQGWWMDQGVEPVKDWGEVVARSNVLIVDNSSIMFEAAALGMGVVPLESPEWRKDVLHGMRFWEFSDLGPTVRPGGDIARAVNETFEPLWIKRRAEIARSVYAIPASSEKRAGKAAAKTILEWGTTL